MNIMYFTDVGFDTPNSNNRLVLSMLEEFLKAGHSVYLVQSHSTGTYEDVPEELTRYKNFSCDTIDKGNVAKTNFVKRYLNGIHYQFMAKKIWKRKIKTMDVVLLQSHFTAWCTAFLMRNCNAKLVFNIYDIFPGEAYVNGSIKSKFIYDSLAFLQKYLYKTCDYFFVLSKDMKRTLHSLGVKEDKIEVTPVWFDEKNIAEVCWEVNKFAEQYQLDPSKKYIQYAGSIGVAYDFDFAVDVADRLKNREDIVFQLVGEGIKLEGTKDRAKQLGLKNVQFLPWQPLEALSDVYSWGDLQIVPLAKEVIRNSYPSKIFPVMACSRLPVISVEKDSIFYDDINSRQVGMTSPIGDVDAMAQNIVFLLDHPDIYDKYRKNAHDYAFQNFTAPVSCSVMMDAFEKII